MPVTANDPTRNPHPLLPDGSFRGGRLPAALAETYVQVDEKAATDWLELARRLAGHLNYVRADNTIDGDWSPFYEKQAAVAAARLLAWPLERLGQRLAEHRELIEDRQGTVPTEQLLDSLFDLLTSAIVSLDKLSDRLSPGTPLRERADALIVHQLAPAFRRWLAYYRAGAPVYFAALGADEVPDYLRDAYAAGGRLVVTQELIDGNIPLSDRWTAGLSWTDYLTEVGTDEVVYGTTPSAAGAEGEILHAVGHVFFHQVYETFVSAALHLRAAAGEEWEQLNNDPGNAPHLALLLAFLQLRERQRELLNGLTDRHLDFYYQRVLRTAPAAARPPRAFLYLEARKNLPPTYLPAGTAFRGGKDEETGTERSFLSQGAVTVSEAAIAEKRTLFKVADDPSVYDFPGENRRVFAAADAGRYYASHELLDYPFGQQVEEGSHLVAAMEPARLGLAIASHYLYLREGTRTVTLRFAEMAAVPAPGIVLNLFLTTEEGWLPTTATLTGRELSFTLAPEDPAILPYNEEVHQQGLATQLPTLRLELPQTENSLLANQLLRSRNFSRVQIGLAVTGIRDLALSGSAGIIDPSAPFHPFGAMPRKGDVLIIGNREVFQKRYAVATYRWSWADSSGSGDVRFDQSTLEGGSFGAPERSNQPLNAGSLSDTVWSDDVTAPSFGEEVPYTAGMSRGYIRFKLRSDWGHADYPTELAEWAAGKAAGETANMGIVSSIAQEAATFYQVTQQAQLAFSQSAAQAIQNFTGTVYDTLSKTITDSSRVFTDTVGDSLRPLLDFVSGLPASALSPAEIDALVNSLPNSVNTLKTNVQQLVTTLSEDTPGALQSLADAIPAAIDDYRQTVDNTLAPLLGNVSAASEAVLVANSGGAPAPPFNPLFADFSLDYSIDLDATNNQAVTAQHGKHQVFHLTPFGSAALPATGNRPFLPTTLPQTAATLGADAGAMFLGIAGWEPGAQLSLLFQIREGTADPLLEKPENHLHWHYLSENRWVPFPKEKHSDGTDGLLRSGLVRLDLPAEVSPTNTRFNDALQWVRLSVAEKVDAVNRLLGVHAHGVEVVQAFTDGQSATDAPLPPGTIAKLALPLPGIKTVAQPYPTFGGAAPEQRDAYFTRLSERLRHKNRGITEWDVEHLVLSAFPEVERVICLQHVEFLPGAVAGTYTYHELRAGHFTVLPLGRSGEDGLRPYVSLSTREAIEAYLTARISCHATLHVRNPLFEEVRVSANVRYHEGTDISWAEGQVQLDLIDYLSPWHDEGLEQLDFTAEVHRSAVVNFLEELPYVDYVKDLTLLHLTDPSQNGKERLRPTKLVSVLAAAPDHLITTVYGTAVVGLTEVCHPPRRGPRRSRVVITDNTPIG